MAASLSVFLCLVTLIQSQSAKSVMSNNMDTDLVLQNDTLQKETQRTGCLSWTIHFLNELGENRRYQRDTPVVERQDHRALGTGLF